MLKKSERHHKGLSHHIDNRIPMVWWPQFTHGSQKGSIKQRHTKIFMIIVTLCVLFYKLSVIRQKGESQNGCLKKTKHAKFSEKRTFLTPWYAHISYHHWSYCFLLFRICILLNILVGNILETLFNHITINDKNMPQKLSWGIFFHKNLYWFYHYMTLL